MSKRWAPAGYDDWKCTDPDAEAEEETDTDTDDWQEPDDTPDLEPQYIEWLS